MTTSDAGARRRRGRPRHRRTVEIVGLDHVQLSMPRGEEALARLFYGGVLGLQEVRMPAAPRLRGGAWFVGPGVAVHLGVEEPFRPARRAHPAFVVEDLEWARQRLAVNGVDIVEDDSGLPVRRCYIADPFGNRIELVEARDANLATQPVSRSLAVGKSGS
jgi:catechol 2,3-dioxygenase-like lactoylglutathione lyase family enzyme